MVQTLVTTMAGRLRRLSYGEVSALLQGTCLAVSDQPATTLTSGEARVLDVLLERAPAVVAKSDLVDPGADGHAAEMAVTRLRAKLGPLGEAIVAVPRRGYRCELTVGGPEPSPDQ